MALAGQSAQLKRTFLRRLPDQQQVDSDGGPLLPQVSSHLTTRQVACQPTPCLNASCFGIFSTSPFGFTVYLGRQTQENFNSNEVSRTLSQIIRHPSYNSQTSDNDIALLQLSSAVEFTNFIRPVCLAADGSDFPAGTTTWVTGWGTIASGGEQRMFSY